MGDLKTGISQRMLTNSIEPNLFNINDALSLYECYNKLESDKQYLNILYKIQTKNNKNQEERKTSSRGSTFKSITNLAHIKKNDFEDVKREEYDENWNVRTYILCDNIGTK
jgi:hypothetical protein